MLTGLCAGRRDRPSGAYRVGVRNHSRSIMLDTFMLTLIYTRAARCRYIDFRVAIPIRSVARLGQKYDFEAPHTEALHRIFHTAPTTLEDFDSNAKYPQICSHLTIWPNLLKLPREHNLLSVLPLALYRCSGWINFYSVDPSNPFEVCPGLSSQSKTRFCVFPVTRALYVRASK